MMLSRTVSTEGENPKGTFTRFSLLAEAKWAWWKGSSRTLLAVEARPEKSV